MVETVPGYSGGGVAHLSWESEGVVYNMLLVCISWIFRGFWV